MSGTGPPRSEPGAREAPQHLSAGAWVGYLIFALILLFEIVIDAQAAFDGEWANFIGITVFTLAFLVVPTGGLRWLLRRAAQARRPTRRGFHR